MDKNRVKGKGKQVEGKAQETYGQAKDKAKDTWDDAKDKAKGMTDDERKHEREHAPR